MASAPPIAAEQAQSRPSFAKVAASALKAQPPKDSAPKARPPVATPRIPPPKTRAVATNGVEAKAATSKSENKAVGPLTDSAPKKVVQNLKGADAVTLAMSEAKAEDLPRPLSAAMVKIAIAEDGSTQLSSSDGSGKPPSVDGGKSVASATTFALDEKESLRPDDSASLRAVEEEDVTSPPDSVAAGSRQGSDNGAARAFRDQLHEIAVIQPQVHRGVPPGRFPNMANGSQTLFDPNQMANGLRPTPQPIASAMIPGPLNVPINPDEKLIEALQSPRDRLFVVKIEQDFIDFIKDSRESEYSLPNCNAFYRMLAHRLADYYGLSHVVDGTMTGVKITRTPYCKIPPPVSQMVDPTKGSSTPPVELPARKIMRRDGKSGTNTAANSRNASKTTSEIGGSDGSNDGNDGKDKAALTREEREARYREARQRIFGNAESEETDPAETNGSGEEKEKTKDVSRTSSAAGKKKPKKQRNYDDDDFQARSHFNVYYPQQFPGANYSGDNMVFYNGYAGPMAQPSYPAANSGSSPQSSYSTPYSSVMSGDAQSQFAWGPQQYQTLNNGMMYSGYPQAQNGYDPSADFQRGMSSYANAGMQSQITPKMANPQMAMYQDPHQQPQHMPINSAWPQMAQQSGYGSSGHSSGTMAYQQPMSGPSSFGQFSPAQYHSQINRNQHPMAGSYSRQFNPQTQSFIPNTGNYYNTGMNGNLPYRGQAGPVPSQMNGYGGFPQAYPQHMPADQTPQHGNSTNSTPSFGSPQSMQGNNTSAHMKTVTSQSGDTGTLHSSIAKYGTPSHLPAKPPAPVTSQQSTPKFMLPGLTQTTNNTS